MYYNFIKQAKEIYEMMEIVDKKYHHTLTILLDEVMYHFLSEHKVPLEKQGEFLEVMFPDCPKAIADYKMKKFK